MANSPSRSTPSPGINRSALRSSGSGPRAEVRLPSSAVPPRRIAPEDSDFVYFLKAVGWMTGGLLGMIALYALAFLMHDSMAAGSALAEAKKERSTLVCQSGRMSHGDGSLHDLVFADSYFVCTDWKTLQAIEMDEKPAPSMRTTPQQ
jgi:hypothetical protein